MTFLRACDCPTSYCRHNPRPEFIQAQEDLDTFSRDWRTLGFFKQIWFSGSYRIRLEGIIYRLRFYEPENFRLNRKKETKMEDEQMERIKTNTESMNILLRAAVAAEREQIITLLEKHLDGSDVHDDTLNQFLCASIELIRGRGK